MRNILIVALVLGWLVSAMGQERPQAKPAVIEAPEMHSVSFASQHGESFTVYIDGSIQNRMPQSRVLVSNISPQNHEVVVVMKRPVEKAAVLYLTPRDASVIVNVSYDSRLEHLYLYTPQHNRTPEPTELPPLPPKSEMIGDDGGGSGVGQPAADEMPRRITNNDLADLLQQLRAKSFDSDRLALAKALVASYLLDSWQIGRMTEVIDFSNSQVDFLKYAYVYCVDKQNYYTAINVLTFSTDKRKVIDYISTQR